MRPRPRANRSQPNDSRALIRFILRRPLLLGGLLAAILAGTITRAELTEGQNRTFPQIAGTNAHDLDTHAGAIRHSAAQTEAGPASAGEEEKNSAKPTPEPEEEKPGAHSPPATGRNTGGAPHA